MARKRVVAQPTGRPVIPTFVDEAAGLVLIREDGQVRGAIEIGLNEDDINRIRAGYICAKCYEDLDTPFPDECPVCHFPMAEKQSELFAKRFQGDRWVGPQTTDDEERAIMMEMRERRYREEKKIWTPSISFPKSLN